MLNFREVAQLVPTIGKNKKWSGRRDSNPRPSPWQGDALPAEPLPPVYFNTNILAYLANRPMDVPRARIELATPAFSVLCSTY